VTASHQDLLLSFSLEDCLTFVMMAPKKKYGRIPFKRSRPLSAESDIVVVIAINNIIFIEDFYNVSLLLDCGENTH
jgi:hypothetical protein